MHLYTHFHDFHRMKGTPGLKSYIHNEYVLSQLSSEKSTLQQAKLLQTMTGLTPHNDRVSIWQWCLNHMAGASIKSC